ncbi:hypothetical protein [Streptomyces plumbiresistens]
MDSPSADPGTPGPVDAVFSMQRDATAALLREMRSQHIMPTFPQPWGSIGAYLSLLRRPRPLALLDVPDLSQVPDLPQRVHVLSRLSAVVVLVPDGTDSVALLRAGAANVLSRSISPMELASRIAAERRWLAVLSPLHATDGTHEFPKLGPHVKHGSQKILLELIQAVRHPWCCHDLCLLLGDARHPLSRRALQARMTRLTRRMAECGASFTITHQWGRTTFSRARPAPDRSAPAE